MQYSVGKREADEEALFLLPNTRAKRILAGARPVARKEGGAIPKTLMIADRERRTQRVGAGRYRNRKGHRYFICLLRVDKKKRMLPDAPGAAVKSSVLYAGNGQKRVREGRRQ